MTDEEARGYTDQQRLAMWDEPEPVTLEELGRQAAIARLDVAERSREDLDKRIEAAKAQSRSVADAFRDLAIAAAKSGEEIAGLAARLRRDMDEERRRIESRRRAREG